MDSNDEIILEYILDEKEEKLRIFGDKFVENNKENCIFIFNNKEYDLSSYFDIEKFSDENELIIKLKPKNIITNVSYMLKDFSSLKSVQNLETLKTDKITNMKFIFYKCSSLKKISDISHWDTKNVKSMRALFLGCSSLIEIPDISNWNVDNVTDISYMFQNCSSIKS